MLFKSVSELEVGEMFPGEHSVFIIIAIDTLSYAPANTILFHCLFNGSVIKKFFDTDERVWVLN